VKWRDIGDQLCPIARALSVVGDRWTMLILREAFLGTRRFEDLQQRTGAARNLLSDRLEKLVAQGVLERRPYQEKPTRYEYRLTEKGLDLYPVMMALVRWGDRWLDDGRGRPIEHRHKRCGQVMQMEAVCSECGERLDPHAVEVGLGPALRSNPAAVRRFGKVTGEGG
jgi:DNA-binding HxlR family transcriptional regulator